MRIPKGCAPGRATPFRILWSPHHADLDTNWIWKKFLQHKPMPAPEVIRGMTGATGLTGATGPTGPTGLVGAMISTNPPGPQGVNNTLPNQPILKVIAKELLNEIAIACVIGIIPIVASIIKNMALRRQSASMAQ